MTNRATTELDDVFDELETLLKNPEVGADLAERKVNVSLALTLADGLRAYIRGDKEKALLELGTATDEIAARMTRSSGEVQS
jgi:CHASE3 domain sensor protein